MYCFCVVGLCLGCVRLVSFGGVVGGLLLKQFGFEFC